MDALSLVIQNRAEEVEFKTLVEHQECYPGGKTYRGEKQKGGALLAGASAVALYLLEGEQSDFAPLKEIREELEDKPEKEQGIFFEAQITPGQGLATIDFFADFLERPLPLDLTRMQTSSKTKAKIEREMKRHFPPVMPYVEASAAIWAAVVREAEAYIRQGKLPSETGLFAKAQPYWGSVDPTGQMSFRLFGEDRFFDEEVMSPEDRLKRENVFGNAPGRKFPTDAFDWDRLFKRLANDYKNGLNVLRMIVWSENWQPNGFLAQPLPARTETQKGHEKTRLSFLDYVRGLGTIEGIPLGD